MPRETPSLAASTATLARASQVAVTKTMRTLEQEAGVPLLQRRSRGIVLTEAGARLPTRARIVTRQEELAREEIRQHAGDDFGSLRIGVTPFLTLTAFGQAFRWFRQRYRSVRVQVIEGLMRRVLPGQHDGSLDLAAGAAAVPRPPMRSPPAHRRCENRDSRKDSRCVS